MENTADIVAFKIVSEGGIAAGVRRIEAITGNNLLNFYKAEEKKLFDICALLKCKPDELAERAAALSEELKKVRSENESLKAKAAGDALGDAEKGAVEINGVKVIAAKAGNADVQAMRTLTDRLKEKYPDVVVILASESDGKVSLIASASDSAVKKGVMAGNIIKEIAPLVGGRGGGRPNMAQAGGTDASGMDAALSKSVDVVRSQIK